MNEAVRPNFYSEARTGLVSNLRSSPTSVVAAAGADLSHAQSDDEDERERR